MSRPQLDAFIVHIRTLRPRMLFGYPSALAHIARHAQAGGHRMDQIGIEVEFVTSERLYDEQRALIEEVFGCRSPTDTARRHQADCDADTRSFVSSM
jgi:phenylacetate-CoA ligase